MATMISDDLRNVGEAAFGPRWQRDLARALNTDERLVRRWVAGDRPLPATLPARLDAVIITRINELMVARRRLQRALKAAA
jgi:hypothetical protein